MARIGIVALIVSCVVADVAEGQEHVRPYAGAITGIATLSADARSEITHRGVDVSLYKPENGPTVNVFAGLHLGRFLGFQANYVWNRNDLTLLSSIASPGAVGFYEQRRTTIQHAIVGDTLLYFREVERRVRPYLSVGVGLVRLESDQVKGSFEQGLAPPEGSIAATHVGLRVAVGIDLAIRGRWSFRYSFSETISGNPVSVRLMPPGERNLANFQNLLGIVGRL